MTINSLRWRSEVTHLIRSPTVSFPLSPGLWGDESACSAVLTLDGEETLDNIKISATNGQELKIILCTVVSDDSCSWSSRVLKVLASLTTGKTDAWEASAELGREGTGVAEDTWVAKGTVSTFLFCSKHILSDIWLKVGTTYFRFSDSGRTRYAC